MKLENINQQIIDHKRTTVEFDLKEEIVKKNPFEQFIAWFEEALQSEKCDPTAMVLATTDENGHPDARIVLLKQLEDNQFIFFTNYNSKKASQLSKNPIAAINFYWPSFIRQVRIKGNVIKIDRKKSETYFSTRPRETQVGAHAWVQSSILKNRDEINERIASYTEQFDGNEIPCPEIWGGYALVPFEYEFFQGRKWRFNDRLLYTLENQIWKINRLAP